MSNAQSNRAILMKIELRARCMPGQIRRPNPRIAWGQYRSSSVKHGIERTEREFKIGDSRVLGVNEAFRDEFVGVREHHWVPHDSPGITR